jgi:hypothetical protein
VYKRPWFVVLATLFVVAVIGAAVSGKSGDEATSEAASTTAPTSAVQSSEAPPPTTQPVVPPPTTPAPTPEAAPGVNFAMPDFVGMDLQSAQNLVQTHGVWLSRSHDLLGSRNQVLDSNWIVCDQNIPAGQQVTGDAEGLIDFGVVKREESCP